MTVTVSPTVGHSDIAVAEFAAHVKSIYLSPADFTAGVYRLAIPLGSVITNVTVLIVTAFSGGGTLKVGDSTSDLGFLATTDITATTLGFMVQSGAKAGAYAAGKAYMTAPGLLVVTLGGAPAAGKARIDFEFSGRDETAKPSDMINNWLP